MFDFACVVVDLDFYLIFVIFVCVVDDLVSKTIKQTEERVSDVKRRAEEAVSDVKRQAVVELQKAVRAAEEKANEAVGQTQNKVDKAVMEARRQAIEETLGMINRQSDSSEVSNDQYVVLSLVSLYYYAHHTIMLYSLVSLYYFYTKPYNKK